MAGHARSSWTPPEDQRSSVLALLGIKHLSVKLQLQITLARIALAEMGVHAAYNPSQITLVLVQLVGKVPIALKETTVPTVHAAQMGGVFQPNTTTDVSVMKDLRDPIVKLTSTNAIITPVLMEDSVTTNADLTSAFVNRGIPEKTVKAFITPVVLTRAKMEVIVLTLTTTIIDANVQEALLVLVATSM